nr:hypothetical protein [Tanacetum cinerariifolium]
MVACLEKTEENNEFHQIVDFLSTCSINYALTTQALRNHIGGADVQTRFETASKRSSDSPLSTGYTGRSGEDRMEQETDLMDFIPPIPYDSPLSGGHTPGSDEGRPKLLELMNICTKLSNRVLALEEAKTTQDKVITRLKLRVRRLEKKRKARTSQLMKIRLFKGKVKTSTDKSLGKDASKQGRNDDQTHELNLTSGADTEVIVEDKGSGEKGGSTADQVSTARPEVSAATLSTPPTTTTIFGNKDFTIAQTLIKMKSEKAKENEVAFRDVEEPPRLTRSTITLQPLPTIDPKDKDLAQRIYKEELAELDRAQKERQKQEEATIAALTEEFDEIQARMDADHELASDEEESADYEQENKELRMWLKVILDEEETVDPEILSTKYPIVDWESQILGNVDMEDKHVYKIIRANGNTKKRYPLIKEMLKKMLNWKLEAEAESTMAFELLKFIKSQIEE